MKIGIISNTPRTGKTTLMQALGYTYSRTQRQKVAMFSTVALSSIIVPLMSTRDEDSAASRGVFRAMLETRTVSGEELFDYSVRGGRDQVYVFDLFDSTIPLQESTEFLCSTVNLLKSSMILVEIVGDVYNQYNKQVADTCDVLINVFTLDYDSIESVKSFMKDMSPVMTKKTIFLCSSYDERILSTKKLSGLVEKGQSSILTFGYSPGLVKLVLDGDCSKFVSRLIGGHEDLLILRPQLEKLMQVLYDGGKVKRIIPATGWIDV